MNNYFIVNRQNKALSMFEANNNAKMYFRKNDAYSFSTPEEAEKFLNYLNGFASTNSQIKHLRIDTFATQFANL